MNEQQHPTWKQASDLCGFHHHFRILSSWWIFQDKSQSIEKKRLVGRDCEIIVAPSKQSGEKQQPKLKKVKVEEDEGSLWN
jgi:hypothetical protein